MPSAFGSPHTIGLSGVGQQLSVSPLSLDFTTAQVVGTTSALQKVTLQNKGSIPDTLSITTTGDFAVSHNCGTTLAVGASCVANVVFSPTAPNTRTGSLVIIDNVGTQTVSLTGTGTIVQLSNSKLNFGSVSIGNSKQKILTVTNVSGSVPVNLANISITGINAAEFSQSNNCPATLVPGSGCIVTLTLLPTSTGAKSATLAFEDDGGGSPQTVDLSGTTNRDW